MTSTRTTIVANCRSRMRSPPQLASKACSPHTTAVVYGRADDAVSFASRLDRKQGLDSEPNVTLTTQCSLDRWPRFVQQAVCWGGPVSVAVYIPAPQSSTAADASLELLHQWAKEYARHQPQQHLLVSALFAGCYAQEGASVLAAAGFSDGTQAGHACRQRNAPEPPAADVQTTPYDHLYPINALRNLALQQATTPLVFPVDADFIPSQSLEQQLHDSCPGYSILQGCLEDSGGLSIVRQLHISQQQHCHPIMLVLPAFQLAVELQRQQQHHQRAKQSGDGQGRDHGVVPDTQLLAVPRTKAALIAALEQGSVMPFDCGVFAPQQQPLDLQTWCRAQEPFELQYEDLFEVHAGVGVRQQLPPYSEAFRGYGLNKQQHAWHAAALGYRFMVLPDAFVVTAPHKRSTTWKPPSGTAADAAHMARIKGVYEQFKQQVVCAVRSNAPVVVTGSPQQPAGTERSAPEWLKDIEAAHIHCDSFLKVFKNIL